MSPLKPGFLIKNYEINNSNNYAAALLCITSNTYAEGEGTKYSVDRYPEGMYLTLTHRASPRHPGEAV